MLRKAVRAVGILAAPFVKRRNLNSTAPLSVRAAAEVMDEHELELRITGFECALEPLVLLRAERAQPVVIVAARARREPERIEHDEQRVAVLPCVVIPSVRRERLGKAAPAHRPRPRREVVRRAVEITPALTVVVADDEMHRHAEQVEVAPLVKKLLRGDGAVCELLGHEGVAEINVERRLVRRRTLQRALVELPVRALVEMRIGGDGENKLLLRQHDAGGEKRRERELNFH